MRRLQVSVIAGILLSAWLSGATGRAAVIGEDERIVLPRSLGALAEAIGLLSLPIHVDGRKKINSCTAFCVGKDLIATAAHCISAVPGRYPEPVLRGGVFRLGYWKGRKAHRKAGVFSGWNSDDDTLIRNQIVSGLNGGRVMETRTGGNDWALIRLAHPVCGKRLRVRAVSRATLMRAGREGRLFIVGLHGDRKWEGLLYSPGCRILDNGYTHVMRKAVSGGEVLYYACDTYKGSSGAPLLMNTSRGPVVVGMNVGTQNHHVADSTAGKPGVGKGRASDPGTFVANIGVPASAFAREVRILVRNRTISEKVKVKKLQELLNLAGYDAGPVDGVLGLQTRRAILAFRKRHGLTPVATATPYMLRLLAGAAAVRRMETGGKTATQEIMGTSHPSDSGLQMRRPELPCIAGSGEVAVKEPRALPVRDVP